MEGQEPTGIIIVSGISVEQWQAAVDRAGVAMTELGERIAEASRRAAGAVFVGLVDGMDVSVEVRTDPIANKANALLESLLDGEQLEMYHKYRCFVVVGGETGDHYLVLTTSTQGNVMCINTGQHWCLVPRQMGIPPGDQFAAQLLMIQCEESRFKAQANRLGCFNRSSVKKHVLSTLKDEALAESILEAAPERREEPEPRRFSNVFEAAMPTMILSQWMYDELDNLGWVQRGEPQWNPGSTCHCPSCEEARERYARERGSELEHAREQELRQIVNDPDAPMDARSEAAWRLQWERAPPRRGGYYGQNRNVTITPLSIYGDDPLGPQAPPFDARYRYRVIGELNPRTDAAIGLLRDRGLVIHLEVGDFGCQSSGPEFEMEIAFRDLQILDEIRYLFGV